MTYVRDVWYIVRLNVEEISADIPRFAERYIQRAGFRVGTNRENYPEPNPMCGGAFGRFGICHRY